MSAPKRIAVLCSFNLDLLKRPLGDAFAHDGIEAELYFSGYGLWESEAIDPNSALYRFQPELVILFADSPDLLPPLHNGNMLTSDTDNGTEGKSAWRRTGNLVGSLCKNLPQTTSVLVHNLARPSLSALGTLEGNAGLSSIAAIDAFNHELRGFTESNAQVRAIDYAGFVAEHGHAALRDERLWHLGRMRLGRFGLERLAALYTRYVAAIFSPRRKCLVLDLDNTLWGGVLGEDGVDGIALGQEGIGLAFREFQLAILSLAQRGIVLAVASKNNPADAWDVIDNHPEMILRRKDFASVEIHWQPKSESLPRIAKHLNLGLDSFVFWDDEPREREIVRTQHPAVLVPEVPSDPSSYARTLLELSCFDVLSLTEEDRRRGQMYREEAQRQQFLDDGSPADLDEFYRSLNMAVRIGRPDNFGVARFAQLTQRTNQFNLTTRRYTEGDVRSMLIDPSFGLYTISLEDRFGDLGVIGAAIVKRKDSQWDLDSFMMSCRALGRGAEDAFLATLAIDAAQAGAALHATFIPSKKNAAARQFLERLEIKLSSDVNAESQFTIDPEQVKIPAWIQLTNQECRA